jgi:hypothetical protein
MIILVIILLSIFGFGSIYLLSDEVCDKWEEKLIQETIKERIK